MYAVWKMMQRKSPKDYVIATGIQYSVKDFINLVLKELEIKYKWTGSGINLKCINTNKKCIIESSKTYFRPLEVDSLIGDPSKAKRELKWTPKISINQLVKEMVSSEMKKLS